MKKVLYTYKWTDGWNKGLDNPKAVTILRKSVEQANRWYETEMYCDSKGLEKIKNLDIPFTRIQTLQELEDYESPNWGMTKLITIKNQLEPHIHIDMDTILLKPIEFDETQDVIWGNAEASLLYGKGHYTSFKYINDHYVKMSEEYEPILLKEGFFDFAHVPNNSLLVINNTKLTRQVIIELQEKIKPYYKTKLGMLNMFMEQFMFMNLLKWRGGCCDYMPRKGEFHVSDYYKELIMSEKIPFSDFEENGWLHFEHLNKYTEKEIKKIIDKI